MPRDFEIRRDMAMRRREMRDMARREREMRDGRNPYGSRGYVTSRDPRRRDRAMEDMAHGMDYNYGDMRGYDGNYDMRGRSDYGYPFEVRGEFDMARRRNSRGQYMSDGHYPMPYMGYNYDYAGDYGEGLTKEELEEWKMKLMKYVEEKDKYFFTKENIASKARTMGAQMKDYNEEELCLVTLMMYTDYCKTIKKFVGANMDVYIELAKDWLEDEDSDLKGSERLAVYHDCIIEGEY